MRAMSFLSWQQSEERTRAETTDYTWHGNESRAQNDDQSQSRWTASPLTLRKEEEQDAATKEICRGGGSGGERRGETETI